MVPIPGTGRLPGHTECSIGVLPFRSSITAQLPSWPYNDVKEIIQVYVLSISAATGRIMSLLKACNVLLAAARGDSGTKAININLSKGNLSADLNGLYTSSVIRGMSDGKTSTNWIPYSHL